MAGAGRDNIDNGFILAYGGIEENCTIRAMFDAKRDELSDIVHRLALLYDAESIRRTSRNVQISGMFGNGGTT